MSPGALGEALATFLVGLRAEKKGGHAQQEKAVFLVPWPGRTKSGRHRSPTAFALLNVWPELGAVPLWALGGNVQSSTVHVFPWFPCLSFSLFEMKNKATCQSGWCVQTCNPHRFRKTSKWKLLGSDYISLQMVNLCPELPPLLWLLFAKLMKRTHSGVICRLMS